MRDISEWTIEDLQGLIADAVPEDVHLEYKASEHLKSKRVEEITRAVTAFANADGGIVVYGLREGNGDKQHIPQEIDEGLTAGDLTAEGLDQMLSSAISPPIPGLRIREIALGEGRRTFAIGVPKPGYSAPHQARDKKYYRRWNTTVQAMHDFEIRALMSRRTQPDLKVNVRLKSATTPEDKPGVIRASFDVSVENLSNEPCLYSLIKLMIVAEEELAASVYPGFGTPQLKTIMMEGKEHPSKVYTQNFSVPHHMPFFQGADFTVGNIDIDFEKLEQGAILYVNTKCPGQSKGSFFALARIQKEVTVQRIGRAFGETVEAGALP